MNMMPPLLRPGDKSRSFFLWCGHKRLGRMCEQSVVINYLLLVMKSEKKQGALLKIACSFCRRSMIGLLLG